MCLHRAYIQLRHLKAALGLPFSEAQRRKILMEILTSKLPWETSTVGLSRVFPTGKSFSYSARPTF